ncbi:DUF1127 domain-containing protein [Pseudomonas trivialis]|uniref:DUF1127 domain-containing protein n=1 Tax=Pseudomonas trivialis TaxID=200450 RepID=UPI0030CAAB44
MKGQKGFVLIAKLPLAGLFQGIVRWHTVYRERRLLAALNDDALKDIGLSRADVEQESQRHFWDDPLRK